MPNKEEEADDKDRETECDEQDKKSKERHSTTKEEREKRKLPEPSGNLRRRSEWFKKRH
jgi:hypothetical protein